MAIKKIISGGQTGADQAGLAAAKILGLETGGTAPRGYRTDIGPDITLRSKYGLTEDDSPGYPARTRKNVQDSDGTVIFGYINSPGSRLTIRCCDDLNKQCLLNPTKELFIWWIEKWNIQILNVAGNRERTNPGIFERTKNFLVEALR